MRSLARGNVEKWAAPSVLTRVCHGAECSPKVRIDGDGHQAENHELIHGGSSSDRHSVGSKADLRRRKSMRNSLYKLFVICHGLLNCEEGQDLVEYALVVALIAFGATAGMSTLASGINHAFNTISSKLASSL